MAGFREQVSSTCSSVTSLATFYFWSVSITTFSASQSKDKKFPDNCKPGEIQTSMDTCLRWMTLLVVGAVIIVFHVRKIVDTAQSAPKNTLEEEVYRLAQEELKKAIRKVNVALANSKSNNRDTYVDAIGERNLAKVKEALAMPKEGLARLPLGMQRRIRLYFFVGLLFSAAAGVAASTVFYFSLRILVQCADSGATVTPFIVLGIPFLFLHGVAARVCFEEN